MAKNIPVESDETKTKERYVKEMEERKMGI